MIGLFQLAGVAAAEVIGTQYEDFSGAFYSDLAARMSEFHPSVVTMCHCETPSGVLNPLEEVGRLVASHGTVVIIFLR
jgi:aspartate aminotransferase-like enzyme